MAKRTAPRVARTLPLFLHSLSRGLQKDRRNAYEDGHATAQGQQGQTQLLGHCRFHVGVSTRRRLHA